jgi:hypothetical protein
MSYLRRFGAFLYDFLVGDAWELFLGPIAAVAIAWALVQLGVAPLVVGALLFAMVIAVLAAHLVLALKSSA